MMELFTKTTKVFSRFFQDGWLDSEYTSFVHGEFFLPDNCFWWLGELELFSLIKEAVTKPRHIFANLKAPTRPPDQET